MARCRIWTAHGANHVHWYERRTRAKARNAWRRLYLRIKLSDTIEPLPPVQAIGIHVVFARNRRERSAHAHRQFNNSALFCRQPSATRRAFFGGPCWWHKNLTTESIVTPLLLYSIIVKDRSRGKTALKRRLPICGKAMVSKVPISQRFLVKLQPAELIQLAEVCNRAMCDLVIKHCSIRKPNTFGKISDFHISLAPRMHNVAIAYVGPTAPLRGEPAARISLKSGEFLTFSGLSSLAACGPESRPG
jgi:hypothetical protein